MVIERQSNLQFGKWNALQAAIGKLIRTGAYETFVNIHSQMRPEPDGLRYSQHRIHGTMSGPLGYRRFLPWHRAYLVIFERAIRQVDNTLSIPYWDWNEDAGRLVGFRNLLGLSSRRNLGTSASETPVTGRVPWFTNDREVEELTTHGGSYYDFAKYLEDAPHNRGHAWIGGDMNSMASPRDPAFWFHHAQVDRIWSIWQNNNPGEKAYLSGSEAELDPWEKEFTVESVDDIRKLGNDSYEYT